MDIDRKREICMCLKRRFPWMKLTQLLRIIRYSSERGGFKHLEGDLSTVGLNYCIKMLTREDRLRAEGLSAKKYSAWERKNGSRSHGT